eukprot:289004-Hanusia_phi.AAC.1
MESVSTSQLWAEAADQGSANTEVGSLGSTTRKEEKDTSTGKGFEWRGKVSKKQHVPCGGKKGSRYSIKEGKVHPCQEEGGLEGIRCSEFDQSHISMR